jgi:2-polyprenyl-3-methyl-5-hydroxy-6-metoxy-1,4-benzoquinol methylase
MLWHPQGSVSNGHQLKLEYNLFQKRMKDFPMDKIQNKLDDIRYGFGKNWSEFIEKHFSEERVKISQQQLLGGLKYPDLKDKTFLDIGCGSGIHSLAALRAGAKQVFSFDYDVNSVKTAEFIKSREGNPSNWTIQQGSVLDKKYMKTLPKFDIVYSWGVLHHTGDMWNAIRNATIPLKDDSLFFIALYSYDVQVNPTVEFWLDIKQKYNKSGDFGKKYLEFWYFFKFLLIPDIKYCRNTIKRFKEHKATRGMELWTDIKDWLGGWPMEFLKIMEMQEVADREFGMELLSMTSIEANAEFLFRKKNVSNLIWDDILIKTKTIDLKKPFKKVAGNCWSISLPELASVCDSRKFPRRSPLVIFENEFRLTIGHAIHEHIIEIGKGRYSHWDNDIMFSTIDNSNPNINGRNYSIKIYPDK